MSVYTLIDKYKEHNPGGHYFDRETLRFFGEAISEMRVLKGTVHVKSISGEDHECYVLSSRQKKAPGGPRRAYHYFDVNTYNCVIT